MAILAAAGLALKGFAPWLAVAGKAIKGAFAWLVGPVGRWFVLAAILLFVGWRVHTVIDAKGFARGVASRDAEVAALEADLATLRANVSKIREANDTNRDTIRLQKLALEHWHKTATVSQARAQRAEATLVTERARLQVELAAEREKRETIYRGNPDAREFSRLAVPRVIVDGVLRQYEAAARAGRRGSDGDDRSPDAD